MNIKDGKGSGFIADFSATTGDTSDKWYMDSGAFMHMTSNSDWMYNVTEPSVKIITVANREPFSVKGVGCIDITLAQGKKIQVNNVLHVPGLAANLLSVSTIVKTGHKVTLNENGCDVHDINGKLVCTATLNNKLYTLDTQNSNETAHLTSGNDKLSDTYLWHLRMAHLNVSDVNKVPNCVEGVTLTQAEAKVTKCTPCYQGKQFRQPFNNVGSRANKKLELRFMRPHGKYISLRYEIFHYLHRRLHTEGTCLFFERQIRCVGCIQRF